MSNICVSLQVKFYQALADCSMSDHPKLIDGIVLTKFDTIDDKAAAFLTLLHIYLSVCTIFAQSII